MPIAEIAPYWIALIEVAAGACIGAGASFFTTRVEFVRELRLKRQEEKLRHYEDIFERLTALHALVTSTVPAALASFAAGNATADQGKVDSGDTTRLDLLIAFYAPELAAPYEHLRAALAELQVQLGAIAPRSEQAPPSSADVQTLRTASVALAEEIRQLQTKLAALAGTLK